MAGTNVSVSKVDDVTIRGVTSDVFPPLLELFGHLSILPKHILDRTDAENQPAATRNAGTIFARVARSGPFRPKKFTPGIYIVLERNPEYWVVDQAASGCRISTMSP